VRKGGGEREREREILTYDDDILRETACVTWNFLDRNVYVHDITFLRILRRVTVLTPLFPSVEMKLEIRSRSVSVRQWDRVPQKAVVLFFRTSCPDH
jgi:hypothetical protein